MGGKALSSSRVEALIEIWTVSRKRKKKRVRRKRRHWARKRRKRK